MDKKWIIGAGVLVAIALIYFILQDKNMNTAATSTPDTAVATSTDTMYNTSNTNNVVATNTVVDIKKVKNNMEYKQAKLSTSMGDIVIEFNTTAPKTVENFKTLMGKSFYDGVRFHRVIKDFMIQTGDPNSKDIAKISTWGQGGPGYKFADELSGKEQYTYGTVAMANSGANTNGSQFFIVSAKPSVGLPPSYTVFAHVVSGMDVVDKIQNVKTVSPDRPAEDVMINQIRAQ